MEYFTFGMKTMRVTQNWEGTTSHKPHWYKSRNYADYPIDIAGIDSGKDCYYATTDMIVKKIIGKGSYVTNTIWLESKEKVITPSGNFKVFIALTHWNDNDQYISKLKVGSIVKKGSRICTEGTDGARANHIHMVCGNADKSGSYGLIQNSNGAWVSKGYCMKPEKVMYVDREFTTKELWGGCLQWKNKPQRTYYPAPRYNGYSLIDGLRKIGVNSSFSNRRNIAKRNGIRNYFGTSYQNSYLLNLLKQGKLIEK